MLYLYFIGMIICLIGCRIEEPDGKDYWLFVSLIPVINLLFSFILILWLPFYLVQVKGKSFALIRWIKYGKKK